jgi:DNA-directed RNA polymerase specialized sigma24 family protein
VRARSALPTDLDGLYAAQRLSMVRLAYLLLGDRSVAESVVQHAFAVLVRRHDRRRDPGAVVADLRAQVVAECRAVRRQRPRVEPVPHPLRDTVGDVLGLPQRQREVVVLELWARLGRSQVAAALRMGERAVESTWRSALGSLRRPEEPSDGSETTERLAEALERRADAIGADDLRHRFGEVLDADARRTARHRRWWLLAVGALVVVALGLAVTLGVQRYSAPTVPAPTPSPAPSPAPSPTALSSPALAPGERTRDAIPWSAVGPGWAVVATATPPTAVTTTLLLVGPDGTRYALGSAPDSIVVQDVSADRHHVMVAVGAAAQEWDLQAGTAREVPTPYGWKSLSYAGPDPSYGYLVLWTDSTSSVRLERWTSDGVLRTEYDTTLASTSGGPRHPGVLVSRDGSTALLSSRDGPLLLLDLATDTVAGPGAFTQPPSCEPLARWSPTEAVTGCGSSVQLNTYDDLVGRPLLVTPVGATPTRAAVVWATSGSPVVQMDNLCSGSLGTLSADGHVTPVTLPTGATGLVPNVAVGGTLYLGGTRCASDGGRLVAYDLTSGGVLELVGPGAGGRTVRQAVVLTAGS